MIDAAKRRGFRAIGAPSAHQRLEPDIPEDLSSDDDFSGRDPVLQAILDTPVAPG